MKCLWCDRDESALVELLCYDGAFQIARSTFVQGVCVDHSSDHVRMGVYAELPPKYFDQQERLELEHASMFGAPVAFLREPARYKFGVRYHRFDSPEGRKVRMRRLGLTDPTVAQVHNPLMALPVDRVTEDEFREAFGMPVAAKGKIFG